jgi:hypothetical protein
MNAPEYFRPDLDATGDRLGKMAIANRRPPAALEFLSPLDKHIRNDKLPLYLILSIVAGGILLISGWSTGYNPFLAVGIPLLLIAGMTFWVAMQYTSRVDARLDVDLTTRRQIELMLIEQGRDLFSGYNTADVLKAQIAGQLSAAQLQTMLVYGVVKNQVDTKEADADRAERERDKEHRRAEDRHTWEMRMKETEGRLRVDETVKKLESEIDKLKLTQPHEERMERLREVSRLRSVIVGAATELQRNPALATEFEGLISAMKIMETYTEAMGSGDADEDNIRIAMLENIMQMLVTQRFTKKDPGHDHHGHDHGPVAD